MKTRYMVVFFSLIFFLFGCAPKIKYMKYTHQNFPPTFKVDVLRTKPVDRKFIELGEISIRLKKSTEEDAVLHLKEKASTIGADAIVILGESSNGAVAVPVGGMYAIIPIRKLTAIAIKYMK